MYGLNKNLKLHFIGVGGIGMSGIAEVLLNLGYVVSGSDINESPVVKTLVDKGLRFKIGHDSKNISDSKIVIYSSAIKAGNPEYDFAVENNIPLIKRAEMLAELMRLKFGVAVAGSHGKTTTTSILVTLLNGLGHSPTYIVGGVVKNLGSNAGLGEGKILVAEADESDGSFHYLNPIITVLTNIDNDHLDFYGSLENLVNSFIDFTNKVPFYGEIILNLDDPTIAENIDKFNRRYTSFGFGRECDYVITNYKSSSLNTTFTLSNKGSSFDFSFTLTGKHNVLNCVGAIIASHKLGSEFKEIQKALTNFEGVGRRLEIIYESNDLVLIDDYAHHPTEIEKTISAISDSYKDMKISIVFEPHRYTRTKNFWSDFVSTLTSKYKTYILPIYPAGEKEIEYIDSEILVKKLADKNVDVSFAKSLDVIDVKSLKGVVVFMGAGPISKNIRSKINEF